MSESITAVMLSLPDRQGMAVRAINDFCDQQGRVFDRQLLVYTSDQAYADRLRSHFSAVSPEVMRIATSPNAIAALSHAVVTARVAGGYFALWDDDNRYHPLRLERQLDASQLYNQPCFFSAAEWHFLDSEELFIYELERRHLQLTTRVVLPSLFCPVSFLDSRHLAQITRKGSPTSQLARAVVRANNARIMRIHGEWWWLRIGVRGDNAEGYELHRQYANDAGVCMSGNWLKERRVLLEHWLRGCKWPRPDVDICGHDGVAFSMHNLPVDARDLPEVGRAAVEYVTDVLEQRV